MQEGPGYEEYINGDVYEGNFSCGKPHGRGSLYHADGSVFTGEFCEGEKMKGTMKYKSGNVYVGEWRRGERQGYGRFEFADGSVYIGQVS